jgi:hypothetical protein
VEARIAVDGRDTDVESLWDWLRHERELRGRLLVSRAAPSEAAMGAAAELVIEAAASGVMIALARSLSVWLIQRRSDITVMVTGPDGRQVSVAARRVADPEQILRGVLEPAAPQASAEVTAPSPAAESHRA